MYGACPWRILISCTSKGQIRQNIWKNKCKIALNSQLVKITRACQIRLDALKTTVRFASSLKYIPKGFPILIFPIQLKMFPDIPRYFRTILRGMKN